MTPLEPERAYDALLEPSLTALRLDQLIVFAVYGLYATFHAAGT